MQTGDPHSSAHPPRPDRDPFGAPSGGLDRRRFLAGFGVLAGTAVLAACGVSLPGGGSPSSSARPARPLTGPDLSGAAPGVRVQDDLFRHVNGAWADGYRIPADKASFNTFTELSDRALDQLKAIIEGIKDPRTRSDEAKIRDVYDSFMDTARIDREGADPIKPDLEAIDKAADKAALLDVIGAHEKQGVSGLVGFYVDTDQKDSSKYVLSLVQSGIGLPDEAYYRDPKYAEVRDKYRAFLEKVAALAGLSDAPGVAARVLAFETSVAKGHWDRVRSRDATATYNPYPWSELAKLAPGYDWDRWQKAVGIKADDAKNVVVSQPSFLTAAAKLWADTDLNTLKDHARIQVVRAYAAYLAEPFATATFDFYSKTLSGVEQQRDRWKRGVAVVEGALGEALGKLYVTKHFPSDAKHQAEQLVNNLRSAYRASFEDLDWMTPATRRAAAAKLEKIRTKIGYPEQWRDYGELKTDGKSIVANVRASGEFENAYQLAKLAKPVDKGEWLMTPQTVNAYYNPGMNEIVFPAAILQPPFFSPDAQAAVNYGGIGAVIGHEIGHAFDDQGAKYDGDGNLKDWWEPADRAEFDKRTKALIAQYDALVPAGLPPTNKVNGGLTVGENLADLGGLSIAIAAYRIAVANRDAGTEDAAQASAAPSAEASASAAPSAGVAADPDLTPLFLSWGRIWRNKAREASAIQSLATDPHAPNEFRANQVVKNVSAFAATFGVKPGDKEWLEPQDRVKVW
ncbi:M13 family metallopeptidase [Tsukamurella tyrosinosolvens]|uniref:M13 family metallopeptidase n=1 Tax=Tsukamurella tyrosinosolvens TaxID=57704 RepID=UPI002DD429C9|nr:M13-type metalloendopeptidase [Tsukamurella tyrosinosolvens]MEC4614091.1 M13-type metalloendopeptidase [Tsukamurella tyrosinosolvens]